MTSIINNPTIYIYAKILISQEYGQMLMLSPVFIKIVYMVNEYKILVFLLNDQCEWSFLDSCLILTSCGFRIFS